MKPFTGFTAALMLATVLAAATVSVLSSSFVVRAAVVGLALGACIIGWSVVSNGSARRFVGLAMVALAVMGIFAWRLASSPSPLPLRNLHVGTILAYGAILLAATLCFLRVSEARALLLAFSITVPLAIADALVDPPRPARQVRWQINGFEDPPLWYRFQPNSTGKNFYPDNPRGYFSSTEYPEDSWTLDVFQGSEGDLDHSESEPPRMRVTLRRGIEADPWHVRLQQAPFQLQRNRRYEIRFLARADAVRTIVCTASQTQEPFRPLAPYLDLEIHPQWRSFECPFVAPSSESSARIALELASSDVSVEFMNVALRDLSIGRDLTPQREFFVSYRFNSLGFRGPDYEIPASPGTFRILALGDSYTLGVGVHEQDTFTARLEAQLNTAADAGDQPIRFEVVNAGVNGYSTRDERVSYERYSSAYEPQLVLLAMVFNDDLSFGEEVLLGYLSTSEPRSLSNLVARILKLRRPERRYDHGSTVRELLRLHESCRQRGARLAVVIFRTGWNEPWQRLIESVTEGVRETDIPVLDLGRTLLEGRIPDDLTVHPLDGHPNEIAHRLAAEEIERFLRSHSLLPL
jgi:hypothetical protein